MERQLENPFRGEVALVVDGRRHVLRLSLGALAELESALGEDSLMALVERFESGRFRAADLMALLAAGLRGGGSAMTPETLAAAQIAGGPAEAVRVAALLLARAFVPPATGGGA